jgi:hypothetical protein
MIALNTNVNQTNLGMRGNVVGCLLSGICGALTYQHSILELIRKLPQEKREEEKETRQSRSQGHSSSSFIVPRRRGTPKSQTNTTKKTKKNPDHSNIKTMLSHVIISMGHVEMGKRGWGWLGQKHTHESVGDTCSTISSSTPNPDPSMMISSQRKRRESNRVKHGPPVWPRSQTTTNKTQRKQHRRHVGTIHDTCGAHK